MNAGLFGFPSSNSANMISTAEFETSGIYSVPAGTQWLEIYAIGAGGGGGSGRRGAVSTARYAGGGAQSGTYVIDTVSLIDLQMTVGSEIRVVIGAGGTGGGVVTTNDTGGNTGTSGGVTQLLKQGSSNAFLSALGGGPGGGGSTTSGSGGSSTINYFMRGTHKLINNGGSASVSAVTNYNMGTGFSGTSPNGTYCPHGAAGGSISATNTAYAGGNVVFSTSSTTRLTIALPDSTSTTIVAGSAANTAQKGENGIQSFLSYGSLRTGATFGFGYGGAGGGAGATTNAGDGGDGYRGGGGAGGGASLNGFNSGAGGRGGNGYCCIIAWR